MKLVASLLFLLILSFSGMGQRMPFFTHHVTNPYLYNPAFAGYDAHPILYLTHRQQWLGVEGAPMSTNLSFHAPTGNANPLSVGADLTHDRIGIFSSSAFRATAAYLIPLSSEKEHYVRLGLSAGFGLDSYDLTGLNTSDDALFRAAQDAGIYLQGRFGLQYHLSGFNLGVSVPNLFDPPSFSTAESSGGLGQFDRAIASVNYRFNLNPASQLSFEPTLLYHHSTEYAPQIEALGLLRFKDSFWVGGGYQQQAGIAAIAGFKSKSFSFSYHFGIGGNELSSQSLATHEVQLGLILGKKKAAMRRKPRLKTQADSDVIPEAVIEAKKRKQKEEKKEKKKQEKAERKKVAPVPERKQPSPTSDKSEIENATFEDIDQAGDGTITLGDNQPTEPRFARVKRDKTSTHPLEMVEGSYLITGTFSQKANAEKLAQQLIQQGYSASVGYNSEKKYYYTHVMSSENTDAIRKRIDKIRREPQFKKAWILVIE
ncbi:PorP/SprF family type IX secretion system membrane protein [Tunicatimonas pelagia]|uniref:PorP/SprF family type IX secretion system membrane protein n=1 Tax=Tunicatimonas pelagia TaxID=931531 RepID=UPI002666181C|nr:PorP/SprF family type IX secretion system membrane protein [Tunicatimonas pelagia]WKN41952.1 PorP/SprF family type IX secretion system membrane protein [Tunicatimonas pelagia]